MRRLGRRVGAAAAVWLVVAVVGYVLGHEPRPGFLALAVAAGAGVLWLLLDVSADTETAVWYSPRHAPVRPEGEDPGLARMHRMVSQHLDAHEVGDTLHRHLADLAERRLVARHGIVPRADPDRTSALLGTELCHLLDAAAGRSPCRRLRPEDIDRIITRIEAL